MIEIMLAGGGGIKVEYSEYTRIVSGSGTVDPPAGAKLMRVAVIGAGGGVCGGGGGCAATKIVKAQPITYSIGTGGTDSTPYMHGEDSSATFGNYHLIGQGGQTGPTLGAGNDTLGGQGIGGDYNYKGGDGRYATSGATYAGGAAGPMGPGGRSGTPSLEEGWGVGGGSGLSLGGVNNSRGASGAGQGASSSGTSNGSHVWGRVSGSREGGEMGGGGSWSSGGVSNRGGSGGLVVEWFF